VRRVLALFAWVSAVSCCCRAVLGSPSDFDSFGGWKRLWGKKTGYFHADIIRGRFWLVDPEGNAFLVLGTEAKREANGGAKLSPQVPGAPNCLVQRVAEPAKAGRHGGPQGLSEGQAEFPYIVRLGLSAQALLDATEAAPGFPDVFSPVFERAVDRAARQQCASRRSDPFLVGYILDDSLPWGGRNSSSCGLAIDFLKLPANDPGKSAVAQILRQRHTDDIRSFASAWGVAVSSWQELLEKTDWNFGSGADTPKAAADLAAISTAIISRYATVCSNAVRRYDPNHLILSPPFIGWASREAVQAIGDALDAFCFQPREAERLAVLPAQAYRDKGKPTLLLLPPGAEPKQLRSAIAFPFFIGYVLREGEHAMGGEAEPFYVAAARAKALVSLKQPIPRYELRKRKMPIAIDARIEDWRGAVPMELEPSPYSPAISSAKATVWLMWDDNHIYMAGQIIDEQRRGSTLTSFVGDDSVELLAGKAHVLIGLRPGRYSVALGDKETRRAAVVVRPVFAQQEERRIVGYTFEAAAEVPLVVPPGFVYRFGVIFRSGSPASPAGLAYPPTLAPDEPDTQAEFILAAPSS
jgi:hypothetical protein